MGVVSRNLHNHDRDVDNSNNSRKGKLIRINEGASGASLRSDPSAPGYLKENLQSIQERALGLIRLKEGASGASFRSAPSAPVVVLCFGGRGSWFVVVKVVVVVIVDELVSS